MYMQINVYLYIYIYIHNYMYIHIGANGIPTIPQTKVFSSGGRCSIAPAPGHVILWYIEMPWLRNRVQYMLHT